MYNTRVEGCMLPYANIFIAGRGRCFHTLRAPAGVIAYIFSIPMVYQIVLLVYQVPPMVYQIIQWYTKCYKWYTNGVPNKPMIYQVLPMVYQINQWYTNGIPNNTNGILNRTKNLKMEKISEHLRNLKSTLIF